MHSQNIPLQKEDLKKLLQLCFQFLNEFKYLTECYIIEYFTENHWQKLPRLWQEFLEDFNPPDIAEHILKPHADKCGKVWPLSLLAFKKAANLLTFPRSYHVTSQRTERSQNKILEHIFRKHVNPKKQHEIDLLSQIIKSTFDDANCSTVIDVGSGQGHLSRLLSIGYNLPVIALEQEAKYLKMAKKFDNEALLHIGKEIAKGLHPKENNFELPKHVCCTVSPQIDCEEFLTDVHLNSKSSSVSEHHRKERYLLTGLHACGDLSATMVRLFKENEDIKALVSVACCYMKLTTVGDEKDFSIKCSESDKHYCYPMSGYLKSLSNHDLPYKSREVSCHAIEDYLLRLKENGAHLKMHCYRAVLEALIRQSHPNLRRPGVQTIKKAYNLSFTEYAKKAFMKLGLPIPFINDEEVDRMLGEWMKVVTFFTLALMVAPVIESVILLDRLMFLAENDTATECRRISIGRIKYLKNNRPKKSHLTYFSTPTFPKMLCYISDEVVQWWRKETTKQLWIQSRKAHQRLKHYFSLLPFKVPLWNGASNIHKGGVEDYNRQGRQMWDEN